MKREKEYIRTCADIVDKREALKIISVVTKHSTKHSTIEESKQYFSLHIRINKPMISMMMNK